MPNSTSTHLSTLSPPPRNDLMLTHQKHPCSIANFLISIFLKDILSNSLSSPAYHMEFNSSTSYPIISLFLQIPVHPLSVVSINLQTQQQYPNPSPILPLFQTFLLQTAHIKSHNSNQGPHSSCCNNPGILSHYKGCALLWAHPTGNHWWRPSQRWLFRNKATAVGQSKQVAGTSTQRTR